MLSSVCRALIVLLILCGTLGCVLAGGGPQQVLIVVNGHSRESLEIGNVYRRARGIPYRQLLTLPTSTDFSIPYATYRQEIEEPIRAFLKKNGLDDEITTIVLTRGVPQMVSDDGGRSVAGLLAAMNLPKPDGAPSDVRLPNPYLDSPTSFSHRPAALHGMYLVTVLDGYHVGDIRRLIEQGVSADGTAPDGRFIFQSSLYVSPESQQAAADLLTHHGLHAELTDSAPQDRNGVMGYLSGGVYSGLTGAMIADIAFRPGAIADMGQFYAAAPSNFDESVSAKLLPASAFIRAGVAGIHGVVGNASKADMPMMGHQASLFDHYTSGFSLAESFFASLPSLDGQNVVLGDPLCAPYANRPHVDLEVGNDHPGGNVPINVTASSPTRGNTIGHIDLYLDDRLLHTVYEPGSVRVVLRVGDHAVSYLPQAGAPLRSLLEGVAEAVNCDPALAGQDGVRAVTSVDTGTVQLIARDSGEAGNEIPVSVEVETDQLTPPGVIARADGPFLAGGGQAPMPARATVSFTGRQVKPGDQVTVQIQNERVTYTVPADHPSVSTLLDGIVAQIETSPALQTPQGVHAYRDPQGMPFIVLEARTPGEQGNSIPFSLTVTPSAGSSLRGYPDAPARLDGGHNGSAASLALYFLVGEPTVHATYVLQTSALADGYHRLRAVAVDASPAQVQGWVDKSLTLNNLADAPVVKIANPTVPVNRELSLPIEGAPSVKQVVLYLDGQPCATATEAPFRATISTASIGRGIHDLWAEGEDAAGNHYLSPPVPLEVVSPPEIMRITPPFAVLAGGTVHRIVGSGFQTGCTVRLAGIPVKKATVITPNILEVVSDAASARSGAVEVANPDGTVGSSADGAFEYYLPHVAAMQVTPAVEVVAPGRSVPLTVRCSDQYLQPMQTTVTWEASGGSIAADGVYTAPTTAGVYQVNARHPDCRQSPAVQVTVGPADVHDGHLTHWLVLGPFADSTYTALDDALIPESTVQPAHGDTAGGLLWKSLPAVNDFVDFAAALTPNTNTVAYANVYLFAPVETPCALVFGSDDGIRIWLNGDPIFRLRTRRVADPNQNTQPITLKSGWNRLLVKVDQGIGVWGFYMRLQTPDGKPLPDITYALDPP